MLRNSTARWEQCLRSGKAQRPLYDAPRRVRSSPQRARLNVRFLAVRRDGHHAQRWRDEPFDPLAA